MEINKRPLRELLSCNVRDLLIAILEDLKEKHALLIVLDEGDKSLEKHSYKNSQHDTAESIIYMFERMLVDIGVIDDPLMDDYV